MISFPIGRVLVPQVITLSNLNLKTYVLKESVVMATDMFNLQRY